MNTSELENSKQNKETLGMVTHSWYQRAVFTGIALQVFFWTLFLGLVIDQRGVFDALAVDFGYFWAAANAFSDDGPAHYLDVEYLALSANPLKEFYATSQETVIVGTVAYPPVFLYLVLPFTLPSSPLVGFLLWTGVNLALTIYVAVRLAERVKVDPVVMTTCALTFFPIMRSLFVGQPGGLILFALWKGVEALEQGRHFIAGAWFGLLLIKPNYVALVLVWFLVAKRWHVLGGIAAIGVALAASTIAILGPTGTASFISTATSFGVRMDQRLPGAAVDMMPSWRGVIANAPIDLSVWGTLVVFVALALSTLALLLIIIARESKLWESDLSFVLLITLLVTILVNPIAHIHAVVLVLVPGVLVASGTGPIAHLVKQGYLVSLFALPIAGILSIVVTGWITWVSMTLFGILMFMLVRIFYFCWQEIASRSQPPIVTPGNLPSESY